MEEYVKQLHSIEPEDAGTLNQFISGIVSTEYSRGVLRDVFREFLAYVKGSSHERASLESCIRLIRSAGTSFDDVELSICLRLVDIYQIEQEYHNAAVTLQEFMSFQKDRNDVVEDSDERTGAITNQLKFELYVSIIRNYLECGEPENAVSIITKAQYLRPSVDSKNLDPSLDIHFKLSQARVYDSSRRFLEAASKYYQVSREQLVDEEDGLGCLTQAIVCGILSPAGPYRSNVLRMVYNDERSKQLPQYPILEKVCFDRLLSSDDVAVFSQYCSEHQLAELPGVGNTTVLTRAVIDHNVLSISKIYKNIRLEELARLVNISSVDLMETFVCKMIAQNRLQAKIDQTNGYIYFRSPLDSINGLAILSATGTATNSAANNSIASLTPDFNERSSHHLLLKQLDSSLSRLTAHLDQLVGTLPNLPTTNRE